MAKDVKSFVVDLTNDISREELVGMIDHALASILMLPEVDGVNIHRHDIAQPLTLLHQVFYREKKTENTTQTI